MNANRGNRAPAMLAVGACALLLVLVLAVSANAANGDAALIGVGNTGTDPTEFSNTTLGEIGLVGQSNGGTGVLGVGQNGVCGRTSTTVFSDCAYEGTSGVFGSGTDTTGTTGYTTTGTGVEGVAVGSGIGVHAYGASGLALRADGQIALNGSTRIGGDLTVAGDTMVENSLTVSHRTYLNGFVHVKRSGVATVNEGIVSVTVPLKMHAGAMVLAVAQQARPGLFVVAAVPTANGFRIYLNKQAPANTRVGWIVIG